MSEPTASQLADELISAEPTPLRGLLASISSIIVKESRWRMRGRRAFVIITVYVSILALMMSCVQTNIEQAATSSIGPAPGPGGLVSGSISAVIGQALFTLILVVQTLLTIALAPALTSGAISMEREKQTLELLITTPISTLGLIVGKLISSLAYVFLLILASIPLMSIVFAFGGVAPDDVVRAYLLLFAVAFGLGSIGLFLSATTKRTQLAAALSYVIVFVLTVVTLFLHTYMLTRSAVFERGEVVEQTSAEFLLLLNPLVADIDLLCTAIPDSSSFTCSYIAAVRGVAPDPASPPRDAFWPRSAVAFIVLGVALTLWSTQHISPSRRARRQPSGPHGPPVPVPQPGAGPPESPSEPASEPAGPGP